MAKIEMIINSIKQKIKKLFISPPTSTYIEFDEFFISEKIFRFFGFKISSSKASMKWKKFREFFFKMSLINMIVFTVMNFTSCVYAFIHKQSFLIEIENIIMACIEVMVLLKTISILFWNKKKLLRIIDTLRHIYPHNAWDQHVFDVQKYLKVLRLLGKLLCAIYMIVTTEFVAMPFFKKFYGLLIGHEMKMDLMVKMYLPIDMENIAILSVVIFISIWAMYVTAFLILTDDLFVAEIVTVLSMEMYNLGQMISEIDVIEDQKEAVQKLKKLIKEHKELIEISEQLSEIFSPVLFVNCFGIMLVICGTSFLGLVSEIKIEVYSTDHSLYSAPPLSPL